MIPMEHGYAGWAFEVSRSLVALQLEQRFRFASILDKDLTENALLLIAFLYESGERHSSYSSLAAGVV